MTVQEFVNIDKDLQTVQDISDVNIIILIQTKKNTTQYSAPSLNRHLLCSR
jgi:hypothetical protein